MSFFVTRPALPVPWTRPTSTPCSAAIRATTGETKVRPLSEPEAAGVGVACGGVAALAGASAGGGVGAVGSAVSLAAASDASAAAWVAGSGGVSVGVATSDPAGAITASTAPTSTVSPS